jgi:mannose-1-phosphate guanylyltransferase
MLQETALRLQHKEDVSEKSIVVCNEAHRFMVAEQLREINAPARIILEPEGRNTAPAAALAAMFSLSEQKEGEDSPVLLVMPADHVIEDVNTFSRAVDVRLYRIRRTLAGCDTDKLIHREAGSGNSD